MLVVSDSDVVIHLAKLGKLILIKEQYGSVFIPDFVENEITNGQFDEVIDIREAINDQILKVSQTRSEKAFSLSKKYRIHQGEAHVKELAERLKAEIFLSNERRVRKAAKEEGFVVVGTIGLILRSVADNRMTKKEAKSLLNMLRADEFRIHPHIIDLAVDSL